MSAPVPPPAGDRPSFLRSLRMVAWGLVGVRKNSEYQQDLAKVSPFHVVLAGIAAVALLVLALVGIVHWVVSGGVAP